MLCECIFIIYMFVQLYCLLQRCKWQTSYNVMFNRRKKDTWASLWHDRMASLVGVSSIFDTLCSLNVVWSLMLCCHCPQPWLGICGSENGRMGYFCAKRQVCKTQLLALKKTLQFYSIVCERNWALCKFVKWVNHV